MKPCEQRHIDHILYVYKASLSYSYLTSLKFKNVISSHDQAIAASTFSDRRRR